MTFTTTHAREVPAPSGSARRATFELSPLRSAIVAIVAAKIAAIILAFDPFGVDAFPLIKSLLSRGFAWVLLALIGLALFRFGWGIVPRTRVHVFVLAFAAAYIVSAVFAENAYVAVFGEHEKYLGLTFVADMLVLYSAVAIAFRRTADWALLLGAVCVAGLASVLYAGLQTSGLDLFRWDMDRDRPFGTFGHADILGHFLSLAFGAALGLLVATRGGALVPRVVAVCAIAVAVLAATSAGTRGSLVGFAGALAAAPFVWSRLYGARVGVRHVLGPAVLALTVVTGVVAFTPLAVRVRETVQGEHVLDRVLLYDAALRAAAERPLTGYGPDNFAAAYPRYRQANATTLLDVGPATSAHNWLLQTAATLGVLGVVTLLALLAATADALWTHGLQRSPIVAAVLLVASAGYWAHGLVAIDALTVDWWPWVTFGSAAALGGTRATETFALRRLPPLAVAAVSSAVTILAAVAALGAFHSNEAALAAKFAWQQGRGDDALGAAVASVREDAGRADRWNWLGLALEMTGRPRAGADAFAEAIARAPYEAAYWSNLARAKAREAASADGTDATRDAARAASLDAARRAVSIDPNAPEPNAVFGEIANLFGDYDDALDAALHAIHLFKYEPSYDLIAAEAALNATDPRDARQKIESVIGWRDSATLRVAAAGLSLLLKDRESAHTHAQRALQLDPKNEMARAILKETGG